MNAQSKVGKVKRYQWKDLDRPGVFRMISKHDLIIPTEHYQRAGGDQKVNKIASRFSWPAFQVISVSDIGGGKYHVIEGGHRTRAALKRNDVDLLPCMVFVMDSVKDEAEAFLEVNVNRAPMTAVARHRAYIVTGDPVAIKVENIVRQSGRRIESSQGPYSVSCINELRVCVQEDEAAFLRVWPVICNLCEGNKLTRDIVLGLFWLERRVNSGISNPRRAKRIYDVGFQRILDGSRQGREYHGNPGSKAIADGMLKQINHGLRNKWSVSDGKS